AHSTSSPASTAGERWSPFLRNHGEAIWTCEFLQAYDRPFRPIFEFFLIELDSRRLIHSAVTRSSTSAWVRQQLRDPTAWNEGPHLLIWTTTTTSARRSTQWPTRWEWLSFPFR